MRFFFYFCQFIKSFRSFHSFWEEEDLSREINTIFTEWHHFHIMTIQLQGQPVNSAAFHVCFQLFLFIIKAVGYQSIGRTPPKFTQLRRNKRFDNFIMLVWVQGSPFHIAAGSHPVQDTWGSNSKVASMFSRTIPTDSSCYNDSEKA